jgi:transcriptional regulator with XRE-family HTH domain
MSTIEFVEEKKGFDFAAALQRSRTRSAYWEEELLLNVARRISDVMADQDVSRSELARRLDVSPAYITKVLRGHANLTIQTMAKIAFVLGKRWENIPLGLEERVTLFGASHVDGSYRVDSAVIEPSADVDVDFGPTIMEAKNSYVFKIPA